MLPWINPRTIEPRTAPSIGIASPEDWPYGPNIDGASRLALRGWARRHGLRYARRAYDCTWLARLDYKANPADWEDHPTGWSINRQRAVYVAQPYPRPASYEPEVAAFAAAHDFRYLVDPNGGWYGHGTVFIAVWNPAVIDTVTA